MTILEEQRNSCFGYESIENKKLDREKIQMATKYVAEWLGSKGKNEGREWITEGTIESI